MMEIRIDYKKCTSCGKCVDSCKMGVLEFFEDTVIVASSKRCTACMKCQEACPSGAIEVDDRLYRIH